MSIYKKLLESIPPENRYKLGKKIDFENGGTELHLTEIAESMVNWEVKLAARLELTHPEVVAIKSDHKGESQLQRISALRTWRHKKGPTATYGTLLEIFVAAKENDYAEVLCSLLRGANSDYTDHATDVVQKKGQDTKIARGEGGQRSNTPPSGIIEEINGVDKGAKLAKKISQNVIRSAVGRVSAEKKGYGDYMYVFAFAVGGGLLAIAFGLVVLSSPSQPHETQLTQETQPSPEKQIESPLKCTEMKQKKDLENILAKSAIKRDKMCDDLGIMEESCNQLSNDRNLYPNTIAKKYFEQNPSPCWENIVKIVCQDFKDFSLAMKWIVKEHESTEPAYNKFCQ